MKKRNLKYPIYKFMLKFRHINCVKVLYFKDGFDFDFYDRDDLEKKYPDSMNGFIPESPTHLGIMKMLSDIDPVYAKKIPNLLEKIWEPKVINKGIMRHEF